MGIRLARFGFIGLALLLLSSQAPPQRAALSPKIPPVAAETRYKNIKEFQGMPAAELPAIMTFMASSLGVSCNHCHVSGGAFEKDDKETKRTARSMIRMVRAINAANFEGRTVVTCNTCHRGSREPQASPAIFAAAAEAGTAAAPEPPAAAQLPDPASVINNYVRALGGRAALARLKTRSIRGTRLNADGTEIPAEVYQMAPNKVLVVATYPTVTFLGGFNGSSGWGSDSNGGRDASIELLAILSRDSEFIPALRVLERSPQAKVTGVETVDGRKAYIVTATAPSGERESFWFDAADGLLLRRQFDIRTRLGSYPFRLDYEDYREVDGVRLAFTLRWSRPGLNWSRSISQVRHNLPIPPTRFESHAPAAR